MLQLLKSRLRTFWSQISTIVEWFIKNFSEVGGHTRPVHIYQVDEVGNIQEFNSTISRLNRRLFLDKLKQHNPNSIGTIEPKPVDIMKHHAQWLSGIAAGAWFELYNEEQLEEYLFRRISPYGNIDVEAVFVVEDVTFDYYQPYEFIHYSNCQFFHIQQKGKVFRFDRKS